MTPIDALYLTYHKWYDRDTPFMKRAKAPGYSAFLLAITLSLWLMLIAYTVLNVYSISLSSNVRNLSIVGDIVVYILCYLFYVDSDRGTKLYNSDKANKIKMFSMGRLVFYLILLNAFPISILILEAIFWKHGH